MMLSFSVRIAFCLLLFFLGLAWGLEPLTTGWEKQAAIQDDYVSVQYPSGAHSPKLFTHIINSTVQSTGREYRMYMALLRDGLPDAFTLELPAGGCCHKNKTSDTASLHNCSYATNAGFFVVQTGCCVGNLVTNGVTIQLSALSRVNFGLLSDHYLIGYMSEDILHSLKFNQLITGAGWLVRNGMPYVDKSKVVENLSDKFVYEKAPRTAIGVAKNGSLYLIQVDGEEDIKTGLDLYEFSEVIAHNALQEAVNLDGGGSSVSVKNGKVISQPTCIDTSLICEREVTSITCVHDS